MMPGGSEDELLREAFDESGSLRGAHDACPPPERLWESACERLSARENERLILHLAVCAPCSLSWRVARDLACDRASAAVPTPRFDWRGWAPLAAAAMLIVAVGLTLERVGTHPTGPPAYRAEEGSWIRPRADVPTAMPRDRFVLRWSRGPEGSTYDVRVLAAGLGPLARGLRLDRPEFPVPAPSLARIPAGTKILWQVTVYLPDGRVADSSTFVTELE
jgi:hypothetical protein